MNKNKELQKYRIRTYAQRVKLLAIEYKGGCCQRCGYNKIPGALVFHHRDPTQKERAITGGSYSFESLRPELDKCDLLCSNCHIEVHAEWHAASLAASLQAITMIPKRVTVIGSSSVCIECKEPFRLKNRKQKYCSHACRSQNSIVWPDKESLKRLVWEVPATHIASKYGASASGLKKYCKRHGIPTPPRGYWQKIKFGGVAQK